MFVDKMMKENRALIDVAFSLHQEGKVDPDSYIIDIDQFLDNAKKIYDEANANQIKLYFMLKQVGRNPLLAQELVKIGYAGAVAVDFKEAEVMMRNNIPLGNVGHLVQIPESKIEKIISYGVEVITVYSIEKINSINEIAKKLHKVQDIMIRVYDENDIVYSGQTAGFLLKDLYKIVEAVSEMKNVRINGVTSFPCYLYNEKIRDFEKTHNLNTVQKAVSYLKECGIKIDIINTPSATCIATLKKMKNDGSNCAEPGHGLSGTTPSGAFTSTEEKLCVIYVSEVSHNFNDKAYCYGGGHYRRSHMKNAICGKSYDNSKILEVMPPNLDSIDYYFELSEQSVVGDTVLMAFRFQIFVTRSDVVLVKGISEGKPEVIGVFDSLGNKKWEDLL